MSGRGAARALAALALLFAAACARRPEPPGPDVVARLGGVDVRHAEFDAFLRDNVGESGGALASEALTKLFDQFLLERALSRLAVERRLAPAGATRADAVEALLAAEARAAPAEAELAAFYEAHRAEFARPERVELRQILTEERTAAERARRELSAGAPFDGVVERLGREAGGARSGDQGVLTRDELPRIFAEVVFKLGEGEVSAVIAAEYGFHVFQVVRRLPAETLSFEAARPEIERRVAATRADEALARLVQVARSRYAVEVFDRNLPFTYRGIHPVSRPYESR